MATFLRLSLPKARIDSNNLSLGSASGGGNCFTGLLVVLVDFKTGIIGGGGGIPPEFSVPLSILTLRKPFTTGNGKLLGLILTLLSIVLLPKNTFVLSTDSGLGDDEVDDDDDITLLSVLLLLKAFELSVEKSGCAFNVTTVGDDKSFGVLGVLNVLESRLCKLSG